LGFGERTLLPVASYECRLGGPEVPALSPEQGHGEFVDVPAEAGVVKVDDRETVPGGDDILRVQVRVNEAVRTGVFREGTEDGVETFASADKQVLMRSAQVGKFPETTPEWVLAHQSVFIPRSAHEPCGRLPRAGLVVNSGSNAAELLEVASHPCTAGVPRDHGGQEFPFLPLEDSDVRR
jgi:hypothetical protein